jgi:hypothetical protein
MFNQYEFVAWNKSNGPGSCKYTGAFAISWHPSIKFIQTDMYTPLLQAFPLSQPPSPRSQSNVYLLGTEIQSLFWLWSVGS